VRAAGLDPVVDESGETRRRGHLAKHGAPALRWALVEAAQHARRANSPDRVLHAQAAARVGGKRAVLTVARKIGRRAYHVMRELEAQAA
jgi:transposase